MHQMTTEYLGDLRTSATHLASGVQILTDPPVDNHGKGEAFSPTDLVSSALSSCMLTIMGIVARRENIDIKGMKAEVTKTMAADPRRIAGIKISFYLEESKSKLLTGKQIEVLKHAAHTCPVAYSIHPDIKQDISFNF